MGQTYKCPRCGSDQVGEGIYKGYARLMPTSTFWTTGSDVKVKLCTECGLFLEMSAVNPEKFRKEK